MAKNFANYYSTANDAIGIEQKIFLKEETTRATFAIPGATDQFLPNNGATVNYTQPIESSPVRSGRHHSSIIKKKTTTEWSLPSYFHVDTTLGAASVSEIDLSNRVLWKSMLGREVAGPPLQYDTATPPSTTFSLFENGDQWALQAVGCFVQGANCALPGDGEATVEFSGMAKTAYLVGIGKSITANAANAITLATGEGYKFPVGAQVMVIKSDGTTRSTDTPTGSARSVVSVAGDVVTVDGAVLADSDGTTTPVYLCYYEPTTSTVINNPQTGLQGSISIVGLTVDCVRSFAVNMTNNHEPENFCFGKDGLGNTVFTPGDRFTAEVTLEMNLNHALVAFLNKKKEFPGDNLTVVLGSATGRRVEWTIPKVIFPVPSIPVPENGTIPVTFTGNAYATVSDGSSADEITLKFK